jgi:hypothetical protein
MSDKCLKCEKNTPENTFGNIIKYCTECISDLISICTCDKVFISGKPTKIKIDQEFYDIPDILPDYLFKKINGKFYGIKGCRGCIHKTELSLQNNFKDALQANISSCVYQKIKDDKGEFYYEYVTDALDPEFDDYLIENKINVGETMNLPISFKKT